MTARSGSRRRPRRRGGFTLVELLVAIAVVVVLAALVVVVGRRAALAAKSGRDVAGIRQISQAANDFTVDYGCFPYAASHTHRDGTTTDHWAWTFKHHAGMDLREPDPWQSALIPLTFDIRGVDEPWAGRFVHYKVYQHLFPWSAGEPPFRQVRLSEVRRPAEVILCGSAEPGYFTTTPDGWNGCGQRARGELERAFYSNERQANAPFRDPPLDARYGGRSLVAYVDGHAALIHNSELRFKHFTIQY